MMIEYIRRAGNGHYGIGRAEVGWILDDNAPMIAIAEAIDSRRNRTYRIYEQGAVDGAFSALSAGRRARVMLAPLRNDRRGQIDEGDWDGRPRRRR